MFATLAKAAFLSTLTAAVWGHAVLETPAPREGGPVHEAQCGAAVADKLEDGTSPTPLTSRPVASSSVKVTDAFVLVRPSWSHRGGVSPC